MAALKIALIGAPDTGAPQLACKLDAAIEASKWHELVVIVDTPALHSELASFDLRLLMGLEATAPSRISYPSAAARDLERKVVDRSIRAALADAGLSFRVLYGVFDERLAQALLAIESLLPRARPKLRQTAVSAKAKPQPWVWMCDNCSDPQCEHRLLTALLAQRAQPASAY
ncbi:MAG: hypothetical protein ABIQ90_05395 [Polaromonas sp.]